MALTTEEPTTTSPSTLFPPQTPSYILQFQFSTWYPKFSHFSLKSTIIKPLEEGFRKYLDADGVFVPEGSEDFPVVSELSDDEKDEDKGEGEEEEEEEEDLSKKFSFPELDRKIRDCIKTSEGGVFPKLNFSSPRDAAWILPASSPLKCTTPADVYLLLKSSDFVTHDLSPETVFDGCTGTEEYELELVLRKWYAIDRSREMRCFVRDNQLIAISQRDANYYDFLTESKTFDMIRSTIQDFWKKKLRGSEYCQALKHYIFDFYLTKDFSRGHIIDFNPYAPRTDSLLFTYEELAALPAQGDPELRVIDSHAHPAANTNAPTHQHNMVPFEALSLSSGVDIEQFSKEWQEQVKEAATM